MKFYDYLFYKFFKFTRLIDKSQKPKNRITFLGPIWILSVLEGLLAVIIVSFIIRFYSIECDDRIVAFTITLILLLINSIYFLVGERWSKIIKKYEGSEDEVIAANRGLLIISCIIIFLIIIFTLIYLLKEQKAEQKNNEVKSEQEILLESERLITIDKYRRNSETYFITSKKILLGKGFKWIESKKLSRHFLDRRLSSEIVKYAKSSSNGWLYEIDGAYGKNGNVPKEAVLGIWQIDDQGNINKNFFPNPDYIRIK